uniref:RNA-directed DNA polymerase, eukaryota, reverse transcriptase zinc-binding domain protein n=1 Tax=Tanacetum cinerariifolium TaxID=118510 RepID=A0A6L2LFH0_TANCI|nr:hypothetical protein [Tanacetum cinerariifolium]
MMGEDRKDQGINDSTNKVSDDAVIGTGSASGSNSKEIKTADVLPYKNRFSALNDEDDSEEIVKWREFCTKIGIICDKVLTPKEVLKSKIDLLQKQIVGGNKSLKETTTKSANRRIIDECNGKRVQSDYNRFYLEAYEVELEKIKSLTWERDLLEVDMFVLSKKPLIASIKEFFVTLFVSFVYAENFVKGRKRPWKNLVDHKSIAGISDFKDCVKNLEIEDLNSYGKFYTWIEKRKDPNLVILKKLNKQSLDKDPLNVLLREEKMIYSKADSDVVLDEERLTKQKTKIKWLREDEEIKAAMFGIKDDKAAGPDGFTSKFFKKAWAIIGQDVCCAIREFFTFGKLLGMPFKEGSLPIRYLGVPMMTRKLHNIDCRVLINNVKKRILDWKDKYLLCADFLWSFDEGRRGFTSVAWKDICAPKNQGCLGLISMKLMNEGLMIKHLWNVVSKKDSLWVCRLIAIDDGSIWDWYGDGVDFEVMNYLRKFILEHYDFSVLIAEYQEVVLHDDLNCYVEYIDWHKIYKKIVDSSPTLPISFLSARSCANYRKNDAFLSWADNAQTINMPYGMERIRRIDVWEDRFDKHK